MHTKLHLCPCCAAHLQIPPRLNAMRCDYCDAELVFISEGGTRGLAMLPNVEHIVPYSDPRQCASGRPFDGRVLLESRRGAVLQHAERRFQFWAGATRICLLLLAVAGGAGYAGARAMFSGDRETLELAALVALLAMLSMPLLGYIALHFQGRAQLVRESVSRWL
jgi:hypothetical protein